MEYADTLKWTGVYLGLWLLAGLVGAALAAAGVALGGLAPLGLYGMTPAALRVAGYPAAGLVLLALGAVAFKFGTAAALVHVVVGATEARVAAALNTEAVKSDILDVLDGRLSEMHGDLTETKQLVGGTGGGDASSFEFESD